MKQGFLFVLRPFFLAVWPWTKYIYTVALFELVHVTSCYMKTLFLRAYARQPARGVEVGGWRVEDWVRVQAEGVDVGRAWGYVAHSLGLA